MSSESPWDLEEAGGYWRRTRGIQEWVPLLVEEQAQTPRPEDEGLYECGHCGVWYVRRNDRQMYCSERCKDIAYRERRKAREQVAA